VARLLASLVFALWLTLPALAGDTAQLRTLGFSDDKTHFSFEEFGIQDGSGFAYSSIYMVNLLTNSWEPGTPVRIVAEDEKTPLAAVRARARTAAKPIFKRYRVWEPGEVLASNPSTEVVTNRQKMVFDAKPYAFSGLPPGEGQVAPGRHELALTSIDYPAPSDCPTADGKVQGFALTLTSLETSSKVMEYRDANVPATRSCPFAYDIDTIIGYRDAAGSGAYVVIVGMWTLGFEGPNRRFLALPLTGL
jgi:predicted secreted protein